MNVGWIRGQGRQADRALVEEELACKGNDGDAIQPPATAQEMGN